MKTFFKSEIALIVGALFSVTVFGSMSSCNGEKNDNPTPKEVDCTPETKTVSANVNGFDNTPGAPFAGLPVAIFHITQTVTSYKAASCGINSASNTLVIQNPTPAKISFGFTITVINSINLIQWQYQGAVTINPGASVDLGEVSKSQYGLTLPTGKIILQSQRVFYE